MGNVLANSLEGHSPVCLPIPSVQLAIEVNLHTLGPGKVKFVDYVTGRFFCGGEARGNSSPAKKRMQLAS